MPPSEESPSHRRDVHAEYYYRRTLGLGELLPAIGVAIGAGMFAFYITRLLLQRTPLDVSGTARTSRAVARRPGRPAVPRSRRPVDREVDEAGLPTA